MIQSILAVLSSIYPPLGALSGFPLYVFLLVLAFTSAFFIGYAVQGTRVWLQLLAAVKGIRNLTASGKKVSRSEVAAVLSKEPFQHLWREYDESVHSVKMASGEGDTDTFYEDHASVPAEAYFTRDVLVDSRLFNDFVRHLPGILTGLGIIGTFSGLLSGLSQFNPTSSTSAVAGLKPLLDGVAHAFIASAVAISCAMIVVFVEKLVLALCYKQVEALNHVIDSLYKTGAGELYLERLSESAEKSEAHAAGLREALVQDLKAMLTNLVEQQIGAHRTANEALAAHIGQAITQSLEKPMQDIGEAVKRASGEQGSAVHGMLEELMSAFMAQIQDTFGGQMRGINESMERSMGAMADVQASLQALLQNIERSTASATSQMSQTLEDAMKQAAANQQVMTEQMREFVQEFRKLVTDEQAKSKQVMDETMSSVLAQLGAAMEHLKQERQEATREDAGRQQQLNARTSELVGGLSEQVNTLIKSVVEQVEETKRNIDAISAVSTRAIDGMNQGALTMGSAAQRFETAGNSVSTVFERSQSVAEQLHTVANTLQAASQAVRQGFDQYENTRNTVDNHVNALTALIENAKQEAGLTKAMLSDMERIVEQLRAAESQSQQYLEKVNGTLSKAFTDFGTHMSSRVADTIRQTDTHLGDSVSLLNGVVQELGTALMRMRKA